MRRIFAIIILLCTTYFLGGYIAIHFELIAQELYLDYAGIVGALASVAGLFSFLQPTITQDDLHSLEIETLKSLAETTEQVKYLERKQTQTRSEIGNLEERKKEMELLVKKAAMSLFLKEQYAQQEQKILARVKSDDILKESLSQISELSRKLSILEEEIEANPNVETLQEVIKSANKKQVYSQHYLDEAIDAMPPLARMIFLALKEFGKLSSAIVRAIKIP